MSNQNLNRLYRKIAEDFYEAGKFKEAKETIDELLTYPNTCSNHYKISKLRLAYELHEDVAEGRTHYHILHISNPGCSKQMIERKYMPKKSVLDSTKKKSVAVENALNILNSAWGDLSDPVKRTAYNWGLGFRRRINVVEDHPEEKRIGKQHCVEIEDDSDSDSD